jgi:hypothetical protein
MYDVNPQGPMMHLKELERQAGALHRKEPRKPSFDLWRLLLVAWRRRAPFPAPVLKTRSF